MFLLDGRTGFRETGDCQVTQFPGECRKGTAPASGAFAFLGFGILRQKVEDRRTANQSDNRLA